MTGYAGMEVNMGKEDNLRPIVLSHEEAVKNGRAGGIASGEARRRRRDTREFLNAYLDSPAPPGLAAFLERMEVPEEMRTMPVKEEGAEIA